MFTIDDIITFLQDLKKGEGLAERVQKLEQQMVDMYNRVESLEQEVPEHEHEYAAEEHEHETDDINAFDDKVSAEVESQLSDAIDATIDSLYIGRK